jgi:hypothetical protein
MRRGGASQCSRWAKKKFGRPGVYARVRAIAQEPDDRRFTEPAVRSKSGGGGPHNPPVDEFPSPTSSFTGTGLILSEASRQLKLLESMFEDPGLGSLRARSPAHPAVARFDLLAALLRGRVVTWPNEHEAAEALARQVLDVSSWVGKRAPDDVWAPLDADTQRWTVEMLKDAGQFEDVMTELFTWGWLERDGFDAHRVNQEGESDIVIDQEAVRWRVEVKRIHMGTSSSRVADVLKKANRQIKKSDPERPGSVFIGIARSEMREALDDRIPNDVAPYIAAARAVLHPGQLRSIAQTTIMWDDVMSLGSYPDPVLYAFRRRSVVVKHPESRGTPPSWFSRLQLGHTATLWVRWSRAGQGATTPQLESVRSGDVVVTQQFRQENEFRDGIRVRHAVEAIREPDELQEFQLDGIEVFLVTRRVTLGASPYTLLITAMRRAGSNELEITGGYRLYRDDDEGIELWRDPLGAFQTLIRRYGLEVTIGSHAGWFIPAAVVEQGQGVKAAGANDVAVGAFVKPLQGGLTEYRWVFALDRGAYRTAVRSHAS